MSEQLTLSAETRERAGKGASRAMRREGRVPAVIYGQNKEPVQIHIEEKFLMKVLSGGHFMNTVVMIDIGGKTTRTLPKDVQFHPVNDRPMHVDFFRIGEHSKVTVQVPIRYTGEDECRGIKRGGVLNSVRHDIELVCDAAEIPEEIVIDLAGYDIGDSIHISQITLPKGSTAAITDRDFTIATIAGTSAGESAAAASDAAQDAADASDAPSGEEDKDEPAQTQG